MKNRKWTIMLLMAVVSLTLSGCRLALPEKTVSKDRFVGFSVILSSGTNAYDKDGNYFDRRVPHEVDGELLIKNITTNPNGDVCVGAEHSDWFTHLHNGMHIKDDDHEEYTIEGTLYLCKEMLPANPILICEYVYQREDGTLYAVDMGSNYSGHLDGMGLSASESWTETDENGLKKSFTTSVKLDVRYDEAVVSAELIEMRGTGEALARHAMAEADEIWISQAAEWALIEETLKDGSVQRTAVNGPLDGQFFEARRVNDTGICVPMTYTIRVSGMLTGGDQAA